MPSLSPESHTSQVPLGRKASDEWDQPILHSCWSKSSQHLFGFYSKLSLWLEGKRISTVSPLLALRPFFLLCYPSQPPTSKVSFASFLPSRAEQMQLRSLVSAVGWLPGLQWGSPSRQSGKIRALGQGFLRVVGEEGGVVGWLQQLSLTGFPGLIS